MTLSSLFLLFLVEIPNSIFQDALCRKSPKILNNALRAPRLHCHAEEPKGKKYILVVEPTIMRVTKPG